MKAVFITQSRRSNRANILPMLRRLLIVFFILTNLTSQVSVAYSCAMMGDAPVVSKKCCCDPEERVSHCDKGMSGERGCCDPVIDVADGPGDQVAGVQAPSKVPDYNPQPLPALLHVLFAVLVPVTSQEVVWDASHDYSRYGTDLYLRTQRLRL